MNTFSYNNGPNNVYNELGKPQLFTHQSLLSMPYNREPHTMPAPSGTPWSTEGIPWGMSSPPQLVEFTGQSVPQLMCPQMQIMPTQAMPYPQVMPSSYMMHTAQPTVSSLRSQPTISMPCKRKSLEVEPVIPPKHFITEEKMAAHFQGLHISSNNNNAAQDFMEMSQDPAPQTVQNVSILEKLKGHKIVLADELKKLRDEPLLPASLIERLEKPCMSLVVWKPKDEIISGTKSSEKEEKELTEEKSEVRKGLLVPQHEPSVMDIEM